MFPEKVRRFMEVATALLVGALAFSVAAGLLEHYRRGWSESTRIPICVVAGVAAGFVGRWIWRGMVEIYLQPSPDLQREDPDLQRVREARKQAEEGQLDVAVERMIHAASKSSEVAVLDEALDGLVKLQAWDAAETVLRNWEAKRLESPYKRASILSWRGFFFLRREEWAEGEAALREVLTIAEAQDIEDPAYLGDIQMKLGWALHKQGRHEDATVELRRAVGNCRRLPSRTELVNRLITLGTVLHAQGQLCDAGKAFDEAWQLCGANGDHDFVLGAIRGLVETSGSQGKVRESIEYLLQEVAVSETLSPEYRSACSEVTLCQFYGILGDQQALELRVQAALAKTTADGRPMEKAFGRVAEGLLLEYRGQLARAEAQLREARLIAGDAASEAMGEYLEALRTHVLMSLGKFDEAEAIVRRSLDRARRMNNRLGMASQRHLLAIVGFERNELPGALSDLRELYCEYERMDMRLDAASALQALAMVLGEMSDGLAEAEDCARRAEKTVREANWRGLQGNMTRTTAAVLEDLGEFEEAERLYREALESDQAIGKELGGAWSKLGMARILTKKAELAEAERLAREAMAFHEEVGCRSGVAEALRALSGVSSKNGNIQTARELAMSARDIYMQLGMRRRALKTENELNKLA